jgi:hypothetical protein
VTVQSEDTDAYDRETEVAGHILSSWSQERCAGGRLQLLCPVKPSSLAVFSLARSPVDLLSSCHHCITVFIRNNARYTAHGLSAVRGILKIGMVNTIILDVLP